MKQKLVTVLALLFAMPFVLGSTEVDVIFTQDTGSAVLTTNAEVQGNYWNWPSAPVANTPTANVYTRLENDGAVSFSQRADSFGTGQQWPSINTPGEWSMYETQRTVGSGVTKYEKQISVWTVHSPWITNYEGAGALDTLSQDYDYSFAGSTDSETPTFFGQHVTTDEPFTQSSWSFINPFN